MPKVLAILPEGFEEVEAVTPIDLWRRGGVEVRVVALGPTRSVTGRSGLTLVAEATLEEVREEAGFVALFLPGGPGVKHLRASAAVQARVRAAAQQGQWLFAICAAPTVLHDAGLLQGRRYTAHFSVAAELGQVLESERVVMDGRIVTSRGAGTALDFALHTLAQLQGPEAAQQVAASICA